jgi:hypothetical protein
MLAITCEVIESHYLTRNRRAPRRGGIIDVVRLQSPITKGRIVMSDLIERYLACWNETDATARRGLIAENWSDLPSYTDPLADVQGRDAIDATIAAVQAQFPGFIFTSAGPVDAHHQQARFTWGLGPAGSEPIILGFDVVTIDDMGRIDTVLGFLDKVPG